MALKKSAQQSDTEKKDPVEPVENGQEQPGDKPEAPTKTAEELAAEQEAARLEQKRLDKEAEEQRLADEQEAAKREQEERERAEQQRLTDEQAGAEAEEQRLAQEREAAGQAPEPEDEFVEVTNVSKNSWRQHSTGMWIDSGETKKLANDGWLRNFVNAGLFKKASKKKAD